MLLQEVSRTLEALSEIIARLQFINAVLEKARKKEEQRRRKQAQPKEGQ